MKHIVGLSGGKDSTAMALRLMEVEPRDYIFVCTPTGDELPGMEGMNGKKAKRIRRAVYGDQSLRQPRKYMARAFASMFFGKPITVRTIFNHPDSLRAKYQRAKKQAA